MAHSRAWTDTKIKLVARDTGESFAHLIGHLDCFWMWAYDHCLHPPGKIKFANPEEHVEIAAEWDGEKNALVASLCDRELLHKRKSGLWIHKFLKNCPDYVRKRIQEQKKRSRRIPENSGESPSLSGEIPPTPPHPTEGGVRRRRRALSKERARRQWHYVCGKCHKDILGQVEEDGKPKPEYACCGERMIRCSPA